MTLKKSTLSQVQIVSFVLLTTGLFVVTVSFFYNSSIGALIGLGLTFWGALLLYIKPEISARKTLIEAALSPSIATLNQLIQELGYKGDITYLPPKYFANPETTKICITKDKYGELPTPEQTRRYEDKPIGLGPRAMFLVPSGIQLSKLLEKALGENFVDMNLESLQRSLPKVITEDLEIAEDFEIQAAENLEVQTTSDMTEKTEQKQSNSDMLYCHKCGTQLGADSKFCHVCGIQVTPVASPPRRLASQAAPTAKKNPAIHARITRPASGLAFKGDSSMNCPICSAIAVAVTKATGKPIRISDIETSEDGAVVEADYVIIEE